MTTERSLLPLSLAGIAGAAVALLLDARRRRLKCLRDARVYLLKGQYYQQLGHAWDHETKEFKCIYRPLYHCEASPDRFEAHVLASSHFERWDRLFEPQRVSAADVPADVRAWLLPGPFVYDPDWTYSWDSAPTYAEGARTRSRHPNRRSHQPPPGDDE